MEAKKIKAKIEEIWQDTSSRWKDEYATRYRSAVISELDNTLDQMQRSTEQLNAAVDITLSGLREFED